MRNLRVLVVVGVSGMVACVAGTGRDEANPAPASTASAPGDADVSVLSGPRTSDWTVGHVTARAIRGDSAARLLKSTRGNVQAAPTVDWNITTGAPVTAAAAVFGASWTSPSSSDILFFGVNGTGATAGITAGATTTAPTSNFFALNNLYTTPVILWSQAFAAGFDRSAVTFNNNGSKVFALDTAGNLRCMVATTGATCGTYAGGASVFGSSPWYDNATSSVYFGDSSATVHRVTVGASTLTGQWTTKPGPSGTYQGAFHSSPVVVGNYIYIGDDLGQVFRLTNGTTAPAAGSSAVAIFDVCTAVGSTAPCAAGWEVRAAASYDTLTDHVYVAANDYVFELDGGAGNWAQTAASPKHLNSGATGTMVSTPVIDYTNGYLYAGLNSKIFKITYPFTGSSTSGISSTALAGGTGASNPSTDPLPYSGAVYLGDTSGKTERVGCITASGPTAIDGVTSVTYGSSITTPMVLDYATGNTNFGYTNGAAGGLVQYPLAVGSYSCPGTQKLCTASNGVTNTCVTSSGTNYGDACRGCCSNSDCGGATPQCVSGTCKASCSVAADCGTFANTTSVCTSGVCSYTCASGYANCDGTTSTNGCNINLNTDVSNCGACATACSNNNIPSPTCSAGVCKGHCADGFVDCDGNRQTNGCEATAACGSCCGTACATGTTCFDNGGTGTCAPGQLTQAYGSNSEHNSVDVSCPSGTFVSTLTFADYGTPYGSAGQSWSSTSACKGVAQASCTNALLPGCRWDAAAGACVAFACPSFTSSATCGAQAGCTWNTTSRGCIATACSGLSATACAANTACAYISALSTCVSSTGFVHDYGASTTSHCALDVSNDTYVTSLSTPVNSFSIVPQNGTMGTGTSPASGTALPLSISPTSPSGYPSDPCTGIYKRMYVQASCGMCSGSTIGYRATINAASPVGYWPLDDAGGTYQVTTVDNAMTTTDATESSATSLTNGQTPLITSGSSIFFSNTATSSNEISAANTATNNPASYSIEAWINATSLFGSDTIVQSLSTNGGTKGYWLYVQSGGKIAFTVGTTTILSDAAISTGTTYHVVATYQSGSTMKLYVNGVAQTATATGSNGQGSNQATLYIGGSSSSNSQGFNGYIDEVAIYNSVLSAANVLAHYNAR